jgi:hypothetical protein
VALCDTCGLFAAIRGVGTINDDEPSARLLTLEAKGYAFAVFTAQVSSFLRAPDVLLGHLTDDAEVSTLFSTVPDEFRAEATRELQRIYELALGMRRRTAEADLKRIPKQP